MICNIFLEAKHNKIFADVLNFFDIAIYAIIDLDIEKVQINNPGVYIFIDAVGRPVYVGMAKNLKNRVKKTHKKYQLGYKVALIATCDEDVTAAMETVLIGLFQPEKNKEKVIKGAKWRK